MMTEAATGKLQVEIWADVVCPWCYIGLVRFENALANFTHKDQVSVIHRAFQLNPAHPEDDVRPTLEVIAEKYGGGLAGARDMMAKVAEVANSEGLRFNQLDGLSGNTSAAHRLLVSIDDEEKQNKLLKGMFAHYFEKAGSLFDRDLLVALAEQSGLSIDWATDVLDSPEAIQRVQEDQAQAASFGATGVPFFVINRKYGISGAQSTETFAQVLDRAWEDHTG